MPTPASFLPCVGAAALQQGGSRPHTWQLQLLTLAGTPLPHAVLEPQEWLFAVPSTPDPDSLTEMCIQSSCNSHRDGYDALRAIIKAHKKQKNSIPGLPAAIATHVIVPEVTSFYKSLRTVAATLHLHFITRLQLLFRLLCLYIPGATEGAWLCATQQCSDTASRAVKTTQQQNSQGSNSKWCWNQGFWRFPCQILLGLQCFYCDTIHVHSL